MDKNIFICNGFEKCEKITWTFGRKINIKCNLTLTAIPHYKMIEKCISFHIKQTAKHLDENFLRNFSFNADNLQKKKVSEKINVESSSTWNHAILPT